MRDNPVKFPRSDDFFHVGDVEGAIDEFIYHFVPLVVGKFFEKNEEELSLRFDMSPYRSLDYWRRDIPLPLLRGTILTLAKLHGWAGVEVNIVGENKAIVVTLHQLEVFSKRIGDYEEISSERLDDITYQHELPTYIQCLAEYQGKRSELNDVLIDKYGQEMTDEILLGEIDTPEEVIEIWMEQFGVDRTFIDFFLPDE